MPNVSILVPIYNVERYLRECLDSLLNQTLDDIEIICINDGSTDATPQILEEYSSREIKIINKENSGYGASMNMGLQAATGEYIGILESDDFADINMYKNLYDIAKKHNADVVISDFNCYWSEPVKIKKANRTRKYPHNKIINIKNLPSLLRNRTTIWSCIYKKELINKYNIRFLETPGASYQDTSFRLKTLAGAERVVAVPEAYVNYRQDNANSSVKSKGKVFIICEEYDEIAKFLDKYPDIKKNAFDEALINKWHGYIWNLGRVDDDFVDEFLDVFANQFRQHYEKNELSRYFYRYIGKNKVMQLLNDKDAFKAYVRDRKGKSLFKKFVILCKSIFVR